MYSREYIGKKMLSATEALKENEDVSKRKELTQQFWTVAVDFMDEYLEGDISTSIQDDLVVVINKIAD
jgi:hypothetical protein